MSKIPRHRGASGVKLMAAKAKHRAMNALRNKLGVMNLNRRRPNVDIVASAVPGADLISVKEGGIGGFACYALHDKPDSNPVEQEYIYLDATGVPQATLIEVGNGKPRIDPRNRPGFLFATRDWRGKKDIVACSGTGMAIVQSGKALATLPKKYPFDAVVAATIFTQTLPDDSKQRWVMAVVLRRGWYGAQYGQSIMVAPLGDTSNFIEIGSVPGGYYPDYVWWQFNPDGTEGQYLQGGTRYQVTVNPSATEEPSAGWFSLTEYEADLAPVVTDSLYQGTAPPPYPQDNRTAYTSTMTQDGYQVVAAGYNRRGSLILAKVYLSGSFSETYHSYVGGRSIVATSGDFAASLRFEEDGVESLPIELADIHYTQTETTPGSYTLTDSVTGFMTSVRGIDPRIKTLLYERWDSGVVGDVQLWADEVEEIIATVDFGGRYYAIYGPLLGLGSPAPINFGRHLIFDRPLVGVGGMSYSYAVPPPPPLHYQGTKKLTIFHSEQSADYTRYFNYLTGSDPVTLVNNDVQRRNDKHKDDPDWTSINLMGSNPRFRQISVI